MNVFASLVWILLLQAKSDAQQVIQAVLDVPELQQFYHSGLPGRKPLVVVAPRSLGNVRLRKFEIPVTVIAKPGPQHKVYLEIVQCRITGSRAEVKFRYPVEGLWGDVRLKRWQQGWRVTKAELTET